MLLENSKALSILKEAGYTQEFVKMEGDHTLSVVRLRYKESESDSPWLIFEKRSFVESYTDDPNRPDTHVIKQVWTDLPIEGDPWEADTMKYLTELCESK